MLQKTTQIEGLSDDYREVDLPDDTSPYKIQAKFEVVSEDMPALSAAEGRIIRKNFIHLSCVWDLGRTSFSRRITDTVVFDEATSRWRITMLAPEGQSDISVWRDAWNAFARNATEETLGTPLIALFKNDPSRIEHYKSFRIETVERLASTNPTDLDSLGAGSHNDAAKASQYLARAAGNADKMAATYQIDKIQAENNSLRTTVADLSSKLTQLLEAQLAPESKKRGRPVKIQEEGTI